MNKNFESILKNNADFIETMRSIVVDLDKKSNSSSEVFSSHSFEKYLQEKKLDKYIKNAFPLPRLNRNDTLIIVDINNVNWKFNIKVEPIEFVGVFKVLEEFGFVVRHRPDKSEFADNSDFPQVLTTFTDSIITQQEAEVVLLTYDVDISAFTNKNLDDFIFPKVNNISIKEAYKKDSIFSKLFRNKF